MLVWTGAVAVPAVVGEVNQKLRFVLFIYYLGGKNYFIADKRSERRIVFQPENFVTAAGFEIGNGFGYRTYPIGKELPQRNVFAKRYQMAFVIRIDDMSLVVDDKQGVQRAIFPRGFKFVTYQAGYQISLRRNGFGNLP